MQSESTIVGMCRLRLLPTTTVSTFTSVPRRIEGEAGVKVALLRVGVGDPVFADEIIPAHQAAIVGRAAAGSRAPAAAI